MRLTNMIGSLLVSCLLMGIVFSERIELKLIDNLLSAYDSSRPVLNVSEALRVNIDFEVRSILQFDEENQVIAVVGLRTLKWNDIYLKWSARQYDGIKRLRFDPSKIWTPDVFLVNAASPPVPIHHTSLLVSNKGDVTYMSPFIYKSMCKTKLHSDVQKCKFEFSSWTYSEDQIDLRMSTGVIDVSRFVPHHTWALEPTSASRKGVTHPCCTEVYPKITYTLNLARRPPPANSRNATDNANKPQNQASQIHTPLQAVFTFVLSVSISTKIIFCSEQS